MITQFHSLFLTARRRKRATGSRTVFVSPPIPVKRGAIVGVFLPDNSDYSALGTSTSGQSVCYSSSSTPTEGSTLTCEETVPATVQVEASISELKVVMILSSPFIKH